MVHRITKPRATILSLSLFPLLSSAIVLPQSIPDPATRHSSSSLWTAGVSSSRKSINFGPDVPSVHHSLADPSTKQQLWNEVYAALPISAVDQLAGDQVAKAFGELTQWCTVESTSIYCADPTPPLSLSHAVDTLHPGSSFRLVDGYRSSHTNVFHAHFLQVIDGVDVANGNLNVKYVLSSLLFPSTRHPYLPRTFLSLSARDQPLTLRHPHPLSLPPPTSFTNVQHQPLHSRSSFLRRFILRQIILRCRLHRPKDVERQGRFLGRRSSIRTQPSDRTSCSSSLW